MNYEESIAYLNNIASRGVKPGQARIRAILNGAGNPHHDYPSLLIGGTNGKGSVSTFIAAVLAEQGLKTGLHTKPHVRFPEERAAVNGTPLNRGKFAEYLTDIRDICERNGIRATYFEVLTALALLAFSREKADIAVVEVGLGGKLDATNILDPILSVVTNVGSDHTDRLGKDLKAVAADKAGIARKGKPFLTNTSSESLAKVLAGEAAKRGAAFYRASDLVEIEGCRGSRRIAPGDGTEIIPEGIPPAKYHFENIQTAVAALKLLQDFSFSAETIKSGIERARIRGRFEILGKKPPVIVDGAHNVNAVRAVRESLDAFKNRPRVLVMGVMKDKDYENMLLELKGEFDIHYFTAVDYYRALPPEKLAETAENLGFEKVEKAVGVERAVESALKAAGRTGLVCILGSLYLAGEVLGWSELPFPAKHGKSVGTKG